MSVHRTVIWSEVGCATLDGLRSDGRPSDYPNWDNRQVDIRVAVIDKPRPGAVRGPGAPSPACLDASMSGCEIVGYEGPPSPDATVIYARRIYRTI